MFSKELLLLFVLGVLGMVVNASSPLGLTAAQRLDGFSGAYGLGGNLGGLTLNDIAYDLSSSFTEACQQVGIKLGLPFVTPASIHQQSAPIPIQFDSFVDKTQFLDKLQLSEEIPLLSPDELQTDSDVLLKSESSDPHTTPGTEFISEPVLPLNNGYNGYSLASLSLGDRLTSKLTSDVPFVTSKYKIRDGKHVVSGYSSHIIHTNSGSSKPIIGGESSVTFNQVHQDRSPFKFPEPTIDSKLSSHLIPLTPFSHEYPSDYEWALTKRNGYVSEMNGGFGSLLTGSYGSVLNNGYKSVQLLSDGGLKGLKFSFNKK